MNKFLEQLDISFRRDPTNYRPRINKVWAVLNGINISSCVCLP